MHDRVLAVLQDNAASLLKIARQYSLCDDDAQDAYQRGLEIYLHRLDRVDPATAGAWLRTVNTAALGDGTSSLRLVVRDTAGNDAERQLEVKVDNAAPGAPGLHADPAWSSAAEAAWNWTGSAEADRAPVAKVEVERCLASQGCAVEQLTSPSLGGPQSYVHAVPEGESTLRVRETDAAGNVGEWSEPVGVRRDRTAPAVEVRAPSSVVAGQSLHPQVTATDSLSGVARTDVEVRTDGGAWRTWSGERAAGAVARFRARAHDSAGNVSGWVESADVAVQPPPTVTPEATVTPVPTAEPPVLRRLATRINVRSARRIGNRLIIRGRIVPSAARGAIRVRAAKHRASKRLLEASFTFKLRVRGSVRAAEIVYSGDAGHLPARARVRARRAG